MLQIPYYADLNSIDLLSFSKDASILMNSCYIPFKQHWQKEIQTGFRPAAIALGSSSEELFGHAILHDDFIFNKASKKGDRTWETGDVFEIFLKRSDQNHYWEMHVTADNFQLIFELPPACERQNQTIDDVFKNYWRELPEFQSKVVLNPQQRQWQVFWKIAWKCLGVQDPRRHQWQMAFCRYDYAESPLERPVLSSTADLSQRSFHRLEEWGEFQVV